MLKIPYLSPPLTIVACLLGCLLAKVSLQVGFFQSSGAKLVQTEQVNVRDARSPLPPSKLPSSSGQAKALVGASREVATTKETAVRFASGFNWQGGAGLFDVEINHPSLGGAGLVGTAVVPRSFLSGLTAAPTGNNPGTGGRLFIELQGKQYAAGVQDVRAGQDVLGVKVALRDPDYVASFFDRRTSETTLPLSLRYQDLASKVSRSTPIQLVVPSLKRAQAKLLGVTSRILIANTEPAKLTGSDLFAPSEQRSFYSLNGSQRTGVQLQIDGKLPGAAGCVISVFSGSLLYLEQRFEPGDLALLNIPSNILEKLEDRGIRSLTVVWTDENGSAALEDELHVRVDTVGPSLSSIDARVVQFSDTQPSRALVTVDLTLNDMDVTSGSLSNPVNYAAERISEDGTFGASKHPDNVSVVGGKIRLQFNELESGVHRLRLLAFPTGANQPLQDIAGNHVGGNGTNGQTIEKTFAVAPNPIDAKHVEYPEFLATAPQPNSARKVNPGDKVETHVIRLFYFRDAHRVAQLINRTAESLNRQAVEVSEQRASDARTEADALVDERRKKERAAVLAAQKLRELENQARELESELSRSEQDFRTTEDTIARVTTERARLNRDLQVVDARIGTLSNDPSATVELQTLSTQKRTLESQISDLDLQLREDGSAGGLTAKSNLARNTYESLSTSLSGLRTSIETARQQAADANDLAIEAQAKEDRAKEMQFRLEVAAAKEDPDTYAAGNKGSVDSVAQCSVSVIGEGLIQVRGPAKGIDKIRTMVHQIDMPVGQVKVEVVTVQMNGENGRRMEKPVGRAEAHLNLGRFLTSQSLMLLRQAIVAEAGRIADEQDFGQHYQVDRDRKYLYGFFGRDFIDELYEMDSEFLNSENKVLSLHSMDTVSLQQALFILALAKNDVRNRILANFMAAVRSDLVQAEFDFRRSAEIFPYRTKRWLPHHKHPQIDDKTLYKICVNNSQRYHFRNVSTFFGATQFQSSDSINPLQREFIRLAQIFKARLISELELKQRVIERALIEDNRELDILEEEQALNSIRPRLIQATEDVQERRFDAASDLSAAVPRAEAVFAKAIELCRKLPGEIEKLNQSARDVADFSQAVDEAVQKLRVIVIDDLISTEKAATKAAAMNEYVNGEYWEDISAEANNSISQELDSLQPTLAPLAEANAELIEIGLQASWILQLLYDQTGYNALEMQDILQAANGTTVSRKFDAYVQISNRISSIPGGVNVSSFIGEVESLRSKFRDFVSATNVSKFDWILFNQRYAALETVLDSEFGKQLSPDLTDAVSSIYRTGSELQSALAQRDLSRDMLNETRRSLEHRKLLDFFIEEQEDKVIDLLEGTRAHIAQMDNYLKRLMVALEDDFNIQFYDPAFVRIRGAARQWDVTLGQVERTNVLTNNRAFAKVTPQATMEFDLPKRKIAIVEAFDGAKALLEDYGALANDPTFLAAAQLMGAGAPNGKVQNVLPGLPTSTDESQLGITSSRDSQSGSALQGLVPDPSVYKFETGTGFEIRPVIQPDGHSIVYDFNYMYTTNIREPVQADEKHLGRIKRHFIDTQVQTTSFEMREVGRYQLGLKAARTSQGVPLLQDIPVVGAAFRPLPSAESAIQQNIILGRTVVYPTLFDIMGLRWAPSVVDLNHTSVRDAEHIVRGRYRSVRDAVDNISKRRFDDLIGIPRETPQFERPDLYYRQQIPSPYHPGGYTYPSLAPESDPTRSMFQRPDRRPPEMRQPPYDSRTRRPMGGDGAYLHHSGEGIVQPAIPQFTQTYEAAPYPYEAHPYNSLPVQQGNPAQSYPLQGVETQDYGHTLPNGSLQLRGSASPPARRDGRPQNSLSQRAFEVEVVDTPDAIEEATTPNLSVPEPR